MEFNRADIIGEIEMQVAYSKFINCSRVVLSLEAAQFCLDHIQFYEQKINELTNENVMLRVGTAKKYREPLHLTAEDLELPIFKQLARIQQEIIGGNNENT